MTGAHVALRPELTERLLEELIYERVRAHVDLLELGWFEADLDLSIRRVLAELDRARATAASDGADAPSAVLAATLIDRAWARVEAEWQGRRAAADDDECPVCLRSHLDAVELRAASADAASRARGAVAR